MLLAGTTALDAQQELPPGTTFIGDISKRAYYAVDCPTADGVQASQRMFFRTEAGAQASGYTRGPCESTGAALATPDTVIWGGGCQTCNERFEDGTRWRQVWVGGQDSLAVFVAMYPDPKYHLLGVYVGNLSSRPVLFDPNQMTLAISRDGPNWTPYRPYTRAEVMEHLAKRYKKERQSQQLLGLLTALRGNVTTTQGSATAIGPGGYATASGSSITRQDADMSGYHERIAQLQASEAAAQQQIASVVLAEQTLDPMQAVSGFVAFEKVKDVKAMVVEVKVNRSVVLVGLEPIQR
jgi:hypothetical protein